MKLGGNRCPQDAQLSSAAPGPVRVGTNGSIVDRACLDSNHPQCWVAIFLVASLFSHQHACGMRGGVQIMCKDVSTMGTGLPSELCC
jgi:hypothetical protein